MPVSEIVNGNSGTIPSSNHLDPSNKVMYGQYGSFVFKDWFGDKPNEKPEHHITHRENFLFLFYYASKITSFFKSVNRRSECEHWSKFLHTWHNLINDLWCCKRQITLLDAIFLSASF
jgi:hypothetical protein